MREDCYAAYACGHVEFDISTLNVGETSYCTACQSPQVIVARKTTNGPRQPLAEKDVEIERLRARIALLEAVSRAYLLNSTPVNAVKLDEALKQSA